MPEALSHLIEQVGELKEMLAKLPKQSTQKEEEYLTPSEMAQFLKISMVTLWHLDRKQNTRPLRVGNLKRYRRSDLDLMMVEFVKDNR